MNNPLIHSDSRSVGAFGFFKFNEAIALMLVLFVNFTAHNFSKKLEKFGQFVLVHDLM